MPGNISRLKKNKIGKTAKIPVQRHGYRMCWLIRLNGRFVATGKGQDPRISSAAQAQTHALQLNRALFVMR